MGRDNGPKQIVTGPTSPANGDLLKFSESLNGWIPTTLDAELAAATAIGGYTLPTVDGSDGDVLSTDGNGVLSWITP